jgi:dolichyl-phosphate beta-glucosyltransferase
VTYSLSVIIPCYNESNRLRNSLADIGDFMSRSTEFDDGDIEWIFVDDGSSDDTRALIEQHAATNPHVTCVALPENRGKGAAVQAGDRAASADVRVFTDCDLASPLTALEDIKRLFTEGRPDLVIASRHAPSSRLARPQPWPRLLAGRLFSWAMAHLHRSAFTDTQCGFKAWHREFSDTVVQQLDDPGWSFDLELISRAEARKARIVELPIVWTDREGTKVRVLADGPKMLWNGLGDYVRYVPRSLILLAVATAVLAIVTALRSSNDFLIYYEAWQRVRSFDLEDLYTPERTTQGGYYYSPLFAVLGLPFTLLSPTGAKVAYIALEFALLSTSLILLKRWTRYCIGPLSLRLGLWVTFLVLFLNTILGQFQSGNISLPVFFLCLVSGYVYLFRQRFLSAFWLGLAINIKVFPIFLVGFAILQRDWKFLGYLTVVLAALALAPALYFGWDINWLLHQEFLQALTGYGAENDYGREAYQSLPSALFRLATRFDFSPALAVRVGQLAVVGAATGVWWTFRHRMRSDWIVVYSFFLAFTAQFVPSSWIHHMGFFYAPLVFLTLQAWATNRRWPYSAAFVVFFAAYALSAQGVVGRPVNDLLERWSVPTLGIWVFLVGAYLYWRQDQLAEKPGVLLRTDLSHLSPGA